MPEFDFLFGEGGRPKLRPGDSGRGAAPGRDAAEPGRDESARLQQDDFSKGLAQDAKDRDLITNEINRVTPTVARNTTVSDEEAEKINEGRRQNGLPELEKVTIEDSHSGEIISYWTDPLGDPDDLESLDPEILDTIFGSDIETEVFDGAEEVDAERANQDVLRFLDDLASGNGGIVSDLVSGATGEAQDLQTALARSARGDVRGAAIGAEQERAGLEAALAGRIAEAVNLEQNEARQLANTIRDAERSHLFQVQQLQGDAEAIRLQNQQFISDLEELFPSRDAFSDNLKRGVGLLDSLSSVFGKFF